MNIGGWILPALLVILYPMFVASFGFDFGIPWPNIFWNKDTLHKSLNIVPEENKNVTTIEENHDQYENENNLLKDTKKVGHTKSHLLQFLQEDDIDSGKYDDPKLQALNSCTRTCVPGDKKTCYYKFYLEHYITLGFACENCLANQTDCFNEGCVTADGFERAILTINKRLPGPSIQVCEGDTIIVDVINKMSGRSTTIHWHGFKMINHKFMDGVPFVTQCPIPEGNVFQYTFEAEEGTHFYHSHDGLQKVDGLVGSLVVRKPKYMDINHEYYDYDLPSHVIVVQDWNHLTADAMFPGLRYKDTEQMATSYLIQGRGQFLKKDGTVIGNTPLAEFTVTQGFKYLFRIIAGTCYECQYIFTIEDHDFLIIETDSRSTQPYRVDSLTMSAGERFSVVVNASRPVGAYWMTVRAVGLCAHLKAHQVAILRYEGGPTLPITERPNHLETKSNRVGKTVNPVNSKCTAESLLKDGPCLHDLRDVENAPAALTDRQPDLRIFWVWDFYMFSKSEVFGRGHYPTWLQSPFHHVGSTVNGIVNIHSPSPLLSQPRDVPQELLCNTTENFTFWKTKHRECVHVIKVPANSVVEIVSVNNASYKPNGIAHPIHLHGYDMHIIEQGILSPDKPFNQAFQEFQDYLDSKNRRKIPKNPVTKDTYPLTARGYAVTRIYTNNRGFWFFHCHFAYHLNSGMSGILQVGDVSTFPLPPPGFPKCGNFRSEQ